MMDITKSIDEHLNTFKQLKTLTPDIEEAAKTVANSVKYGGTVFWMGNGGSAADAQHFAAELIGRFQLERHSIASIALSTDTSILTCLSNDYDYSIVFSRQIEALCKTGDVVIALSTSGNSQNILKGIEAAKAKGAFTIGLTGKDGGELAKTADITLQIPSNNTARIQEAHAFVGHTICEWVENAAVQHKQETHTKADAFV
jgi:D-sedoheptulose 7-phosphate isomerase